MSEPESMRRWWRARPESWWWIALVVLVPVLVLAGVAAWVLLATTHPTQTADQINVVKTALAVGAGTGGVITLILASRRQLHTERAQLNTEHDATQRRITELYTKAADQLGSDKAPVRLAGLYALERLAQDNPGQRQTIVNVLCAYLRMPYDPPGTPPDQDATRNTYDDYRDTVQEQQVRLAGQRILTTHRDPGYPLKHPPATFWPDIDLDLTGATLLDLNLSFCQLRAAQFLGARFVGDAQFTGAQFTGGAQFTEATFAGGAQFDGTWFLGGAGFTGAQFTGSAQFTEATFAGGAQFDEAQFTGGAQFTGAQFAAAWFDEVTFAGGAQFDGAQFAGGTGFDGAQFTGGTGFDGAESWVRLDVPDHVATQRTWPAGWVVQPCQERPAADAEGEWGRLVYQPDPDPAPTTT